MRMRGKGLRWYAHDLGRLSEALRQFLGLPPSSSMRGPISRRASSWNFLPISSPTCPCWDPQANLFVRIALLETNIALENGWLEYYYPISIWNTSSNHPFSGAFAVSFRECTDPFVFSNLPLLDSYKNPEKVAFETGEFSKTSLAVIYFENSKSRQSM